MAGHKPFRTLEKRISTRRRRKINALKKQYEEEMVLEQVRQALELTQEDMAKKLKTSQANISKLEKRSDMLLSTLAQYVNAAGGELLLVARVPGIGEVRLQGLGELQDD